ncbi:F-box protein [Raphanus sativus]|nr:F-box protein [Raphanus sativus]
MKRRSKVTRRSHEPTREIPFDLVVDILMRLPAKSLMKFKSVSKLWSSLICSQYFTKRFQRVSSSTPRLYMSLSFFDNSHDALLSASLRSDSGNTISSFEADQDFTIPAMRGYHVSHVFRGLMCFVNGQSAKIYNTTTRQLVLLPDIEESNIIPEDHKGEELSRYLSEQWVLLLGEDVSTRRWQKVPCQYPPHMTLTQGLTINGRMYSLAWVHLPDSVLVSFDVNTEEIIVQ